MPWTDITRPLYVRNHGRYASDCTDAEWALIEPFMPERRTNGRPQHELGRASCRERV